MDGLDHALAFTIAVALPTYGYLTFPRVRRKLAEDRPGVRVNLYRRTMLWQWSAAAFVLGSWVVRGRSPAELGLGWPGTTGTWIALLLALAVAGIMTWQLRMLAGHPELHAELRERLEKMAPFLPRGPSESSWFFGVAVTAGVCEELLFRGVLLTWAGSFVGSLTAVVLTSVVFGLGHLYQGGAGVAKTTAAGLVAGGLCALGGTLWIPMLLHAFVDVHGGLVYRVVLRTRAG
jgi:membrane protease YdiL (CAAX protease family)